MPLTSTLTRRLGITHPIIQAPMAGGPTTPALVTAVCEAGGMGFLAGAYTSAARIGELAAEVRQRTARPFGINLFAPLPVADPPAHAEHAVACLRPYHDALGLPPPALPAPQPDPFPELFAAALDCGAAVFSFTFGIPPAEALEAARARGMLILGTATTVDEARALVKAGVDAVVAQGSEAGGHRGTFQHDFESSMVGTMALVPQVVDAVPVPVVASGGIMDGRGVAAALALGAAAVQMGTAFLACDEAGVSAEYKAALFAARESDTRVTRAFSGRPARGIVNRFMDDVDRCEAADAVLPYPLQNALTRPLRTAAAQHKRPEFLSLWAGQGVGLAQRQSAAQLVDHLAREAEATIERLSALQ